MSKGKQPSRICRSNRRVSVAKRLHIVALWCATGCLLVGISGCGQSPGGSATGGDAVSEGYQVFKAVKGPLTVTVTEDGNVESGNNVTIKCRVEGGASILEIVEDGAIVSEGDQLVKLDDSSITDNINAQKIAMGKAESAKISAEAKVKVAQINVEEYLKIFEKDLKDQESNIVIAEENLRSSQNSLEYSERMFQRGYISQLELESSQFAVRRSDLELTSAKTAKEVMEMYTKQKTLTDLESQVAIAETGLKSELAAYELELSKLKRLEDQLENCLIVAPSDGMVVYANKQGRFGSQGVQIEEGSNVRQLQDILWLPDLDNMQVKVKVHETKVEDLKVGMRAAILIQGNQLQGQVERISNQPESTSWFQGNIKEYATIVKIDGAPGDLKPGMTAEVEIRVDSLEDVIKVPLSSVVEEKGKYHCFIQGADGTSEKRIVEVGLSDETFVEVKNGVEEGDTVIRNPRAIGLVEADTDIQVEEESEEEKFGDTSGSPRVSDKKKASGKAGGRGGASGRGGSSGGDGGGSSRRGGRGWSRLKENDADGDGKISKDEAPENIKRFFDRMDKNKDGFIEESEVGGRRGGSRGSGGSAGGGSAGGGGRPDMPANGKAYIAKYDTDSDGKVSKEEFKAHPETSEQMKSRIDSFWSFMAGDDGVIDEGEADAMLKRRPGGGGGARPGGGRPGGGQ
ncbi:MAG: hypothetical protein CMJ75_09585 [Planctomycetaceae bacterium]|nr:hypothetical protein [Planctomycetaceae bacterium]